MIGTLVVCRLGGDEGAGLVGQKGHVVSVDGDGWLNVDFDGEVVPYCHLTVDWVAERGEWKDPGGWYITDCSPVVERVVPRLDAGVMAGLAIAAVIMFTLVLASVALVLR